MSSVSRLHCLLPIVLCGIYCLFSPAIAGTVHLKNGRVIRGPVVARDDDGGGKLTSRCRFNVRRGRVYHFAVDGWGGAEGDINGRLVVRRGRKWWQW